MVYMLNMALYVDIDILSDKRLQSLSLSKLRLMTIFDKKLFNVIMTLSSSMAILSELFFFQGFTFI